MNSHFFFLLSFLHIGESWNGCLLLIVALSMIALTIFIERMIILNRSEIDTNRFIILLSPIIREKNIIQAIQVCEETGGTISNIVKAALNKHQRSKGDIESAMELQGLIEIANLEKGVKILSIIAYIAPLIGLFGTVIGFIQAFSEMRLSGLADISASKIGEAMEYALITTAAGLALAIPSIIAYNYLVSRIEQFLLEIQTASSEILDLLLYHEEAFHE